MIHELGVELQARLRAKRVPFVVVDGPETTQPTSWARERIVLEYDGQDKFSGPLGQRNNPAKYGTFTFSAKATIYAQSPRAGAMLFEHRRRAHEVLRQIIVNLSDVCGVRRNGLTFTGGSFVTPADAAKSDVFAGAVYELKFSVDTGVPDLTWTGDAKPEAAVGSITSTTRVRGTNDGLDDETNYETSCGDD